MRNKKPNVKMSMHTTRENIQMSHEHIKRSVVIRRFSCQI